MATIKDTTNMGTMATRIMAEDNITRAPRTRTTRLMITTGPVPVRMGPIVGDRCRALAPEDRTLPVVEVRHRVADEESP